MSETNAEATAVLALLSKACERLHATVLDVLDRKQAAALVLGTTPCAIVTLTPIPVVQLLLVAESSAILELYVGEADDDLIEASTAFTILALDQLNERRQKQIATLTVSGGVQLAVASSHLGAKLLLDDGHDPKPLVTLEGMTIVVH